MTRWVWAIEDCRSVSRRLEEALIAVGERVVRVAPHRMGASRRGERDPGKSDEVDSVAIARAVVKDGIECFRAAFLDAQAMEIRLLADHRRDLVAERIRTQNRLRWHLVTLAARARGVAQTRLARQHPPTRSDRPAAAAQHGRCSRQGRTRPDHPDPQPHVSDRRAQGRAGDPDHGAPPALLADTGCGALTAAILIGRTVGAERFVADASFALQTGTAPLKCSSGYASNTGSTAAATASSTTPCTSSRSSALATTRNRCRGSLNRHKPPP
jgi:transposase